MRIHDEFNHKNLLIKHAEGSGKPDYDNNVLTVYSNQHDYDSFQKVDLFLSDKIVKAFCIKNEMGHFEFFHGTYVEEDDIWNWRTSKDISVIKALNVVGYHPIPKKEKHAITFNFGRTKLGKETLIDYIIALKNKIDVIEMSDRLRLRQWDMRKEIQLSSKKTKFTLHFHSTMIKTIDELFNQFDLTISDFKKLRTKAVFEPLNETVDLSDNFKKTKKGTKT